MLYAHDKIGTTTKNEGKFTLYYIKYPNIKLINYLSFIYI